MTPTYVDNTRLVDTATCSAKTVIRHVLGFTTPAGEEKAAMIAGSAAHEALAAYFRGGTRKEVLATFRRHYKAWAEEHIDVSDKYLKRLSYQNTRLVLKYWLQAHPLESMIFTVPPENVEVGFAYPLSKDESIVMCGRLDAGPVVDKESDKLSLLDSKTTGGIQRGWIEQFRVSAQMTGYHWGVGKHVEGDVTGVYINAIEFSWLPGQDDPDKKCRVHGAIYEECRPLHVRSELFVTQRTPEQLRRWRRTALALARRYEELQEKYTSIEQLPNVPEEGTFTNACRWCQFSSFCLVGRKPDLVSTMLIEDRWEPYEQVKDNIK